MGWELKAQGHMLGQAIPHVRTPKAAGFPVLPFHPRKLSVLTHQR